MINNDRYVLSITVGKASHFGLLSVFFLDLTNLKRRDGIKVIFDAFNKFKMPTDSESGNILYTSKKGNVSIIRGCRSRKISFSFKSSDLIEGNFILDREPEDSMCIATPFDECKKYFFYNQKIIGMRGSGFVKLNNVRYMFDEKNTFSLLDWGRGVWPYRTKWYWGAAQGIVNDKVFGFNFGYGFGNTERATENMLFYDGLASKLKDVTFIIPDNLLDPWFVTSSNKRAEFVFTPIYDRSLSLNAFLVSTKQNQVFGTFSGKAILDGGEAIHVNNLFGFLERVENRW